MLATELQKENIFTRAFSQTAGLFILLLIALWGARFTLEVVSYLNEMSYDFVEAVDPFEAHN